MTSLQRLDSQTERKRIIILIKITIWTDRGSFFIILAHIYFLLRLVTSHWIKLENVLMFLNCLIRTSVSEGCNGGISKKRQNTERRVNVRHKWMSIGWTELILFSSLVQFHLNVDCRRKFSDITRRCRLSDLLFPFECVCAPFWYNFIRMVSRTPKYRLKCKMI